MAGQLKLVAVKRGVMSDSSRMIVFAVEAQRFGVRLSQVERVISAVEVTPLPGAPRVVLGVVDMHGEIVPVYDTRVRFGGQASPVRARDQFLLLRRGDGMAALVVQETIGVFDLETDAAPVALAPAQESEHGWFDGTTRLADDLVLIHDVDRFLSAAESGALNDALRAASQRAPAEVA